MISFSLNFYAAETSRLRWVWLLSAILILGCNNNDLSDLNDLAEDTLNSTSYTVELDVDLVPEQVVSNSPIDSASDATGSFLFDSATASVSGEVAVRKENGGIISVVIGRGFAGQKGSVITGLSATEVPDVWRVPDNFFLTDGDVELLQRGGLYVQISTANHMDGELRAQLIIGNQELMINPITADQVIGESGDSAALGTSYLTVDQNTGDVQGSVWLSESIEPQKVVLRQGIAGKTGEKIVTYQPDNAMGGVWSIPQQTRLNGESLAALTSAAAYVQVSSENPDGELRGQVYSALYYVDVAELSGLNLVPQVMTQATGKVFLTVDGYDGKAQAILRLKNINARQAFIYKAPTINNFDNMKVLFAMEQKEDYWQLPAGSLFNRNEFIDLGKGKLLVVVESPEYMFGEIGGWL